MSARLMPPTELSVLTAVKNIIGTAALLLVVLALVPASTALVLRLALPVPIT